MVLIAAVLISAAPEAEARRAPVSFEGDYLVPGDLREVERFCRRHDAVAGDLIVDQAWMESDLTALSCIQSVGGRLVVKGTRALESLDGLSFARQDTPLAAVRLVDNAALVDLSALASMDGLRTMGLVVQGNEALTKLRELPSLVGGAQVTLTDNRSLVSVALPDAVRRGTELAHVQITNNPSLESVSGLARVGRAGAVRLQGLPQLHEAELLVDLHTADSLDLIGLPRLDSWRLAPRLGSVDRLVIEELDGLRALPALADLSRAGEVRIVGNERLEDISGLVVTRGDHPTVDQLQITGNPRLSSEAVDWAVGRLHLPVGGSGLVVAGNARTAPGAPPADGPGPSRSSTPARETPGE